MGIGLPATRYGGPSKIRPWEGPIAVPGIGVDAVRVGLASIRVLFRRDDSLCLYGIPYGMRPGQSPRDLWRFDQEHPGVGALTGWAYLGSPGWWLHWSGEERAVLESWLRACGDQVPCYPFEWSTLNPNPWAFLL